ncbi:uncharacterized protein LAJ45_09109 [Morchella importuna]|uniref:uncharacterized protein n=1 Tax=Morchella importuna TaxID=1174673 RepID=UPI001E8DDDD1|nr:uncharacterized protein LAJ45_09109 [Morchella importuna]KAH8146735.1 hypothetical protein LAJ45_09109 [Morchella importuna]
MFLDLFHSSNRGGQCLSFDTYCIVVTSGEISVWPLKNLGTITMDKLIYLVYTLGTFLAITMKPVGMITTLPKLDQARAPKRSYQ